MMKIVVLAFFLGLAYGLPQKSEINLVPAVTKLSKCIHDLPAFRSILSQLKNEGQHGKEFATNFAEALQLISKEFHDVDVYLTQNGVSGVGKAIEEIASLLTNPNPKMDKRAPLPLSALPHIIDTECLLEKMLQLLKDDSSFQNLVNLLSRPKFSAIYERVRNSQAMGKFSQSLSKAGVSVSDINSAVARMFHWELPRSSHTGLSSPLNRFTSLIYELNDCSWCPGCTACLTCCMVKNYM